MYKKLLEKISVDFDITDELLVRNYTSVRQLTIEEKGIKWGTTSANDIISGSVRNGQDKILYGISTDFGALIKLCGLIKLFLNKTSCKCETVKYPLLLSDFNET